MLRQEMERAIKDKDEETRRELEHENKRVQEEIERVKKDAERFAIDYRKEKERLEVLAAKAEFEGRQEVDRAAAVLASEEALFLEEVEDLPNKGDHAHEDQKLGILSVVEVMWGRVFRMGL